MERPSEDREKNNHRKFNPNFLKRGPILEEEKIIALAQTVKDNDLESIFSTLKTTVKIYKKLTF